MHYYHYCADKFCYLLTGIHNVLPQHPTPRVRTQISDFEDKVWTASDTYYLV